VFALEKWRPGEDKTTCLNVGTGVDLTIHDLANAVARATGLDGTIHWDIIKHDGRPKKKLGVSKLARLGWPANISHAQDLKNTVALFRQELARNIARQYIFCRTG
jgi:GDP-L-fucose synthase